MRAVDGGARRVARVPRAAAAAVGTGLRRLLPAPLYVPAERTRDGRPVDVAYRCVRRDLREPSCALSLSVLWPGRARSARPQQSAGDQAIKKIKRACATVFICVI